MEPILKPSDIHADSIISGSYVLTYSREYADRLAEMTGAAVHKEGEGVLRVELVTTEEE